MPTQAKVAAHVGCSSRNVQDLVASGAVPNPRSVTLDEWRLAYIEHLRGQAAGRLSEDGLDLVGERARLAKEQADAQEMKNAVTRGEQVRGDDVDLFLLALVGGFTKRMRAIPPKCGPLARAALTDAEAEAVLGEHIDEALDELADAARAAGERGEKKRAKAS